MRFGPGLAGHFDDFRLIKVNGYAQIVNGLRRRRTQSGVRVNLFEDRSVTPGPGGAFAAPGRHRNGSARESRNCAYFLKASTVWVTVGEAGICSKTQGGMFGKAGGDSRWQDRQDGGAAGDAQVRQSGAGRRSLNRCHGGCPSIMTAPPNRLMKRGAGDP